MKRHALATFFLTVVAALVVAACGGGAATATPQATTRPPQPTATSAPAAVPAATSTPVPAATSAPQPTATATPRPAPTATPVAPTATPTGPQPKVGGTLQVHWYQVTTAWDTWSAAGAFSFGFTNTLLSNLIKAPPGGGAIVGDLAERWEVSQDGKVITFFLHKDAQFHDGKPVTSKDVLYNFQRASDPKYTYNKARMAPITTMETPDAFTFKVTLKQPSNRFLGSVATPFVLVYPSHITDMAEWQKTAIGSGPFKLKSAKVDSLIAMERDPNYFGKDAQGRKLPYLDAINFNVIVDSALALSSFRTGRVQCACIFGVGWVLDNDEQLRRDIPGGQFYTYVGSLLQLYFNQKKAPFDNLAFRQAVAIGLDKESIGATFARGKTTRPVSSLIPVEVGGQWSLPKDELQKLPGYRPNRADDVALARQKFQESGIDPKKVSVKVQTDPTYNAIGEIAASLLSTDLGLPTTTELISSVPDSTQRKIAGDFQVYVMSEGGAFDDPLEYHDTRLVTGGALNYGGWSNARYDQLLAAQDAEPDVAKRRALIWDLQRIELTEFPKLPIFFVQGLKAAWPEVKNLKIGPLVLQNYDFSQVWVDK